MRIALQKKIITVAVLSTFGSLPFAWAENIISAPHKISAIKVITAGDNQPAVVSSGVGAHIIVTDGEAQTRGKYSHGLLAEDGGIITATVPVDIVTTGDHSRGIFSDGFGSTVVLGSGSITTSGLMAVGASTANGGLVSLAGTPISTSGIAAHGLHAASVGIINASNVQILTTGDSAYGALADGGGRLSLDNSSIRTDGVYGYGVYVDGVGSRAELVDSAINTQGRGASGVMLHQGASATISDSRIQTSGRSAYGVDVNSGNNNVVLDRVQIQTSGEFSAGIWAPGTSKIILRDSHLETFGNVALGIDIRASTVDLARSSIVTHGANSHGLYASEEYAEDALIRGNDVSVSTTGDGAIGAVARLGAEVSLVKSNVVTTGAKSHGVFSGADSRIQLDDTNVRTEGVDANAAVVSSSRLDVAGGSLVSVRAAAISASGNADIRLHDGTQVIGGNGTLMTIAKETDQINLTLDNRVSAAGDIRFGANADANGDGLIHRTGQVTLNNQSYWKGATDAVHTLSLDNGSAWEMTGDSTINYLNVRDSLIKFNPEGGFKTLLVTNDLTGNGNFEMHTDVGALQGDLLKVEGAATGIHQILVHNTGPEPTAEGQHMKIVETEGGNARFNLLNTNGVVDAGTYQYSLESGDTIGERSSDWHLVNTGKISEGTDAGINTASSSQMTWMTEMDSLVKRMGELRLSKDHGGAWGRSFVKQQNINNNAGRPFDQRLYGTQFGADTSFRENDGRLYVGGMAGLSVGDRRFSNGGNGRTDSYNAGAYATWLGDNDIYVDVVGKVNWFKNSFDTPGTDGKHVTGNYSTPGVGLSIEIGKHIELDNNWFIEPQAQLTSLWVQGKDYSASNGIHFEGKDSNSFQTRFGGIVGKKLFLGNGNVLQPYGKLSAIYEFDGINYVKSNGIDFSSDLRGSRIEAGMGIAMQLGKANRLYIDLETAKGPKVSEPWGVNVGYRFVW